MMLMCKLFYNREGSRTESDTDAGIIRNQDLPIRFYKAHKPVVYKLLYNLIKIGIY